MERASARYDALHLKDILPVSSIERKLICMWYCGRWSPRSPLPDKNHEHGKEEHGMEAELLPAQ